MRKLTILFGLMLSVLSLSAQLEVGLFGGGSFYMGDMNPNIPFYKTNPAYGFLARYNFNSRWAAKLSVYQGKIEGDDASLEFLPERALTFESGIDELAGTFEFHFLDYYNGSMREYWTPYIFGGLALLHHTPERNESDLRDYGTEGQNYSNNLDEPREEYSYYVISIPFGIGVKYSFSKKINASLEWGMRKAFSDYLDDVSQTYYQYGSQVQPGDSDYDDVVQSDPNLNHDPKMQRGYSKTNDWYSFAGLTLTYYIDMRNKNKCSDFQEGY